MNAGSEGSVTGHDAGTSLSANELSANDGTGMTSESIIVAKQKRRQPVMRPSPENIQDNQV
jgi:hypothetical protein